MRKEDAAATPATRRGASLSMGGTWLRQPQELHMKRLLGLLLGMRMVGYGRPSVATGLVLRQPCEVEPRKVNTFVDPIAALVEQADGSVGQSNQAAISARTGVD